MLTDENTTTALLSKPSSAVAVDFKGMSPCPTHRGLAFLSGAQQDGDGLSDIQRKPVLVPEHTKQTTANTRGTSVQAWPQNRTQARATEFKRGGYHQRILRVPTEAPYVRSTTNISAALSLF